MIAIGEWQVELYKPGDEKEILELFKAAFGSTMSQELWKWKYKELPVAEGIINLVRDESGVLRGHQGALPLRIRCMGEDVVGLLRLDLMVHPERQRMGIGDCLVDSMRKNVDPFYPLVYAFNNPKSTGLSGKKSPSYLQDAPIYWRVQRTSALSKGIGWFAGMPGFLEKALGLLLRSSYRLLGLAPLGARSYALEQVAGLGDEAKRLDASDREGCLVYIPRDEAFLRWRFDGRPEADYRFLLLKRRGAPGNPVGYVVLAVDDFKGFVLGFIVDVLIHPPSLRPARYLLSEAMRFFDEREVDVVGCMMTGKNPYTRALRTLGFLRVPQRFLPHRLRLLIRVNDPGLDKDLIADPDNWVLTWADTDLV